MAGKIKFKKDDSADEFEPTDSEDEYSEEEKEVLAEVRKGRRRERDPKQQLMAFDESEDDDAEAADEDEGDDDEEDGDEEYEEYDDVKAKRKDMADSDVEASNDEDDLPDPMDWGSNVRNYYHTDFVDPDYSSYTAKEREMAELEEEEAKAIQIRMLKDMGEEDFICDEDFFGVPKTQEANEEEEVFRVESDISGLSATARKQLFKEESPEFEGLLQDFEDYLGEVQVLIEPVLQYNKQNGVPTIPAFHFAEVFQNVALSYCSNIAFYMLLKGKRIPVRQHPIIKRLQQCKQVLTEMKDRYETLVKPQLEALLERIEAGDKFEVIAEKPSGRAGKRKLDIMSQYATKKASTDKTQNEDSSSDEDEEEAIGEDEEAAQDGVTEEEARRGITYQIAKNKGLTPHRKKELRNPRVKNRGKFRKALIRRKGAVRTVRTETSRYGGEISGIKATVSKSIKFK